MANLLFRSSSTADIPTATSVKNAPLTNLEVDGNFRSVNTDLDDKLTLSGDVQETVTGVKTFEDVVVLSTQASQVSHAVAAGRSISSGDGLSGGGNLTADRTFSLTSISAGSGTVGAIRYNGTNRAVGQFYGGITAPTATTRLNYDGLLRATRLQGDTIGVGTAAPATEGQIAATSIVLSGNASAVNATFSGDVSAVDGTFSGDVGAVDGSFSGTVSADTVSATSGSISGTLDVRGAIDLADDDILRFGTGDDAEFFTNGTHFYLDLNAGIGNFYIRDGSTTRFTFDDAGHFTASGNIRSESLGVGTAASGTPGEIRATNQITSYYSDERLKEDIVEIEDALLKVMSLRGVTYKPNAIAESIGYKKESQVGVIAQDVERVLPEAVKPAPFDLEVVEGLEVSKSGENYKTVQYEKLVPLLIEAIKELNKEVQQLKGN